MKAWTLTFCLLVATILHGQSSIADIAQKLGITYSRTGTDNAMVYVDQETIGMNGSLDTYGYMSCFTAMAGADKKAGELYGTHTSLKTEVNTPSYVDSYSDYNKMETAISVGSAWISIIWKYEVDGSQDLYLSLDCHKGSYSFLMIVKSKPKSDVLSIVDVAKNIDMEYVESDSFPDNQLVLSDNSIVMHATNDSIGFSAIHQAWLKYYKAAEQKYGTHKSITHIVDLPSTCKINEYAAVSLALEENKANIDVIWRHDIGNGKYICLVMKCRKNYYRFILMFC